MIGRKKERRLLETCLASPRPELLAVYGRRRIGKTYLIRKFFNNRFSFYTTGLSSGRMKDQLRSFGDSLREYGPDVPTPGDWYEAFSRLKSLLSRPDVIRDPASGRRVVFLDELPWMDTPRSAFKSALDHFWNSWGSTQNDLLLIVCGSATSWIIDNLLSDKGGFYNRVTRQIHLQPFTLKECEELFAVNGVVMTRRQLTECYMILGGVPYYLNCIDSRLNLAQNIDELCFREHGQLYYEYERLFHSLFKKAEKHMAVIEALAAVRIGMTRVELAANKRIGDGEPLTKALNELEQSGFIRKYLYYGRQTRGHFYQLIDPFTLFMLRVRRAGRVNSWMSFLNTPAYYAWCGNSFELVCLLHIPQIKHALGISGVETSESTWRSTASSPGAQIDLLIDRRDNVIDLCEIKYTFEPFVIDAPYEKQLLNKLNTFIQEAAPRKSIHLTMITSSGLAHSARSGCIQNEVTADDLFT